MGDADLDARRAGRVREREEVAHGGCVAAERAVERVVRGDSAGRKDGRVARRARQRAGTEAPAHLATVLEGSGDWLRALQAHPQQSKRRAAPAGRAARRKGGQAVAATSRTSVRRMWLPDGSRNPESIPYGRSSGASTNSTPRPLSSS